MKRTHLDILPNTIPASLRSMLDGADVYDSSCSKEAKVYFIDRDSGYYLKSAPAGYLQREAEMGRYFHSLGLGAEVLGFESEGARDYLLTRCVPGEDMTHADCLAQPDRLATLLGETLRALHDLPTAGCPGVGYLDIYLSRAAENYRTGHYETDHFPDSFGYRSAEEAWATLEAGRSLLRADTLIHGDYCLPNILQEKWQCTGFIDLGNSGVADRHIDLFWGAWSLAFNLGTDAYRRRFFHAYGRDRIDEERLRIVAAAEVFG